MVRWQYAFDIEQLGLPKEEALVKAVKTSRDRCRTPMQWENAPNAGFCPLEVSPWLPVNPNYAQGVNVGEQINDPDSMLNFYKRMLSVRRNTPALIAGDYTPLHEQAEDYLAFLRTNPEDRQTCLVVLNFSENPIEIHVDSSAWRLRLVFSTQADRARMETLLSIKIAPFEIYIAEYV
jgi:alpha-glucosidase